VAGGALQPAIRRCGQERASPADWCGGKGHLGRLLALHWQVPQPNPTLG
jgi:hypothetical protein